MKGAVDLGLENSDLAYADGREKVEIIHTGRHHDLAGMTLGGNTGADIDPGHDLPAKSRANRIRVGWQHDFSLLNIGVAGRFGASRISHKFLLEILVLSG